MYAKGRNMVRVLYHRSRIFNKFTRKYFYPVVCEGAGAAPDPASPADNGRDWSRYQATSQQDEAFVTHKAGSCRRRSKAREYERSDLRLESEAYSCRYDIASSRRLLYTGSRQRSQHMVALRDRAPAAAMAKQGYNMIIVALGFHIHQQRRLTMHPQRSRGHKCTFDAVGMLMAQHCPGHRKAGVAFQFLVILQRGNVILNLLGRFQLRQHGRFRRERVRVFGRGVSCRDYSINFKILLPRQ